MVRRNSLAGNVCLQAFSKLGGNRLGRIILHKVSPTNLVTTIKDLQRQASLLLCHPKRTSNYMKLELENIALPSLTYRDDMTEEDNHKVLSCLQNATHGSKLELSWNEDDTEALRVLQDRFGIDQGPRVTFAQQKRAVFFVVLFRNARLCQLLTFKNQTNSRHVCA